MGLAAAPPRERTLHVLLTWRMAFFFHFAATQASSPRTCEQTSNRVASEAASAAARRTRTVCHWRDRLSVKIVETWEPRTVYNKPMKMKPPKPRGLGGRRQVPRSGRATAQSAKQAQSRTCTQTRLPDSPPGFGFRVSRLACRAFRM